MSRWNQSCSSRADKPSRLWSEEINHHVSPASFSCCCCFSLQHIAPVFTQPHWWEQQAGAHLRKSDESDYILKNTSRELLRRRLAAGACNYPEHGPPQVQLSNYQLDGVVTSATLGGRGPRLSVSSLIYEPLRGKEAKSTFMNHCGQKTWRSCRSCEVIYSTHAIQRTEEKRKWIKRVISVCAAAAPSAMFSL